MWRHSSSSHSALGITWKLRLSPAVAIGHYLRGDTLIEAYWKSVATPGQGIFIGEPLAAPFRRARPR